MTTTLLMRERGALTLPAELCRQYNIQTGDALQLMDVDGVFVLTTVAAIVPELASEIEQARVEAGVSADAILKALREERARYVAEQYGVGDP